MSCMQGTDENFMVKLVQAAQRAVARGYYSVEGKRRAKRRSLVRAIRDSERVAVIAEVKFSSPSEGRLRKSGDARGIARAYEKGGAVGISVLTAPEHFDGSLTYLSEVKRSVRIPVLMKDIIVDPLQLDAAHVAGADAILLIANIFVNRLVDRELEEFIAHSHSRGLEVLLEAHTKDEYELALKSSADIVGINNRNLETLETSLETSEALLRSFDHQKPVICESGISSRNEILTLRTFGADGFLVGSALMRSSNPESLLRELLGG